jgi:AmiR/NasT family two-component response regulator
MARGSIQELMLLAPDVTPSYFVTKDHRRLIKQAVELGVYACILASYEEWEVLTMIRNIIAKNKLQEQKKTHKNLE